jgi:CubicO group peptidase (beta-lactamase class C family)
MPHRITFLFMFLALVLSLFAYPQAGLASASDSFAMLLEECMPDLLVKYRVPEPVATYFKDGKITWVKGFGVADVKTQKRISTDMILNFGSTGKVLTAWGAMRLR